MNKKRNVSYIKPEDPEFLKILKKQAGYDDTNHKFDKLPNVEDFVDDEESEQPQIVVLKEGDLTAEEVEVEKKIIEKQALDIKADLSQRVIFKSKQKSITVPEVNINKRKHESKTTCINKKRRNLLSFGDDDDDNDE